MEERKLRRSIQGVVVNNKNDKTIVVLVETHKKHMKYGKRVKYRKKYYAHDEKNAAKPGDVVTIMECRKLSALKRYRLVSIDKTAELSIKEAEAELKEEILTGEVAVEAEAPKAEEPVEEKKEEAAPAVEAEAKPAKKPAAKKAPAKKPVAEKEEAAKPAAKKPAAKKTVKKEAE